MKRAVLDRLLAERAAKRPVALITNLETGRQHLVGSDDGGANLPHDLLAAAREALAQDRSLPFETGEGRCFIQVHNPPLRLIIVGAVHIAQPLARMATLAGYDVTVVDPRRAFASDARFPDVAVSRDWPDEALKALAPDTRSAVVTLTHDPKLDDPALAVALKSPAFYIASLGSKRTHAKRCERLREEGFGDAEIGRIHGPAGHPIGAKSPAEIAIAIMAQLTQVRRESGGGSRPPAA